MVEVTYDIKKQLSKRFLELNTFNQQQLFKLIKKCEPELKYTSNSNGLWFNSKNIRNETWEKIVEFMEFVSKKNSNELELERQEKMEIMKKTLEKNSRNIEIKERKELTEEEKELREIYKKKFEIVMKAVIKMEDINKTKNFEEKEIFKLKNTDTEQRIMKVLKSLSNKVRSVIKMEKFCDFTESNDYTETFEEPEEQVEDQEIEIPENNQEDTEDDEVELELEIEETEVDVREEEDEEEEKVSIVCREGLKKTTFIDF